MKHVLPVALSVQQPWAYAIMHMGKDIENRTWAPPHRIIEKRIWIHASKKRQNIDPSELLRSPIDDGGLPTVRELVVGAIIGSVFIVGVRRTSSSRWYRRGSVGWKLADPEPLAEPVVCRGQLGIWTVGPSILERLAA